MPLSPAPDRRPPGTLFVLGVARSGTTALADLLDAHPEVVLGMERYKALLQGRLAELTPDRFGHDRFFDFSDGLTNLTPEAEQRWAAHYERAAAKWDAARYVGDKLTAVRVARLRQLHPAARFVVIVRDVAEVAASWDRRAANAADIWDASRDAARAVEQWAVHNRRAKDAAERWPEQVTLVEYSRFFGDPEATGLRRLAARLGLDPEPLLPVFAGQHRRYVDVVRDKPREVPPHLLDGVDPALWDSLVRLAV